MRFACKAEMVQMEEKPDRYMVPGLVRGLNVLKLFTPETPVLRLSDIARALGISRSAAFRTTYTLTEMGCLLHDVRDQSYSVGAGVLRLTYGFVGAREITEIAQPELEALRNRLGWSAHMGILDGTSVLYVVRVPALPGDMSIVQVGRRLPARSTTMGRVLLADLTEAQLIDLFRAEAGTEKGRSMMEVLTQARADRTAEAVIHAGDFEAGIVSVGAAIRDISGRAVAAINVTSPNHPETVKAAHGPVRQEVVRAACRISRLLGFDTPSSAK
ncbi:IclR family transcriptional regulator [Paracoccus jeotgali]|uniref:IclR family transcriptional regulator n=1 Tax=Paracoccus jeotgali TaxID=2065379 RepID=UPI0028A8CD31|nr:IclR family transcriptional regulator [Paracoccus jeotgali]